MPLPTVYLASEDLLASLRQAMSWTETVAQVTEWAVKTMTGELLRQEATQKSGGGKRKADVSALVRHWGAMREYWGGLEPYFWELSRSLPADADTALDWWVGILKYAAWQTFEQAEALAGIDAEALKAVAAGRRQLAAGLAKVFMNAEEA